MGYRVAGVVPEATITLTVDGRQRTVRVDTRTSLLDALGERLGVTSPKKGCDHGQCGACTVLLDGRRTLSCLSLAVAQDGGDVVTAAGLGSGDALHPVQQAWLNLDVPQCGFCQPGQIMAAVDLLNRTKHPTDADIDAIENVCRCGTYGRIRAAIKLAAQSMP